MRLVQSWRNYLAQVVLEADLPVVTPFFRRRLVGTHTDFFVEASERDSEARREHFDALFDAAIDVYLRALREGYPESQAREITHVQATWDFLNYGWGELAEFPADERATYRERYADFYDRHGCSPDDPLGEFVPEGGLPEAPATPDRRDDDHPMAASDLADGVYVVSEDLDVRVDCERPSGAGEPAAAD